ncbi:SH3 domain-containing protein [Nitrosospira multiformis]|uniref:SH3 domain-containing protein n=1 Tax=Nitrosospira multiformis TaxID=1231 RepID=UPI000895EC26|nr:SH3 domain-containing protein [Nitrosospira multiformis]SEA26858.1 SH3-like domain-containing protein [Nitrosospira multiformis]
MRCVRGSSLKISSLLSRGLAILGMTVSMFPPLAIAALEFYSINDNGIIMYDAPSLKAGKVYVASRNLPVEAIVKVDGWVKVRDSEGALAWVEEKALSEKRHILVTSPVADVYQVATTNSPLMFQVQQGVILEWLEPPANGWVRVRHRDGQTGYVRTSQVWGS